VRGRWALRLLIVLAAVLPYLNALRNDFVWDDRPLIVEDYHLQSPRFLREIFFRDFFSHSDDELKYGYYRPLITLSYMADLRAWGLRAAGFHATNIFLHALCALLVYGIARRLFPASRGIGFLAGILFAVHPIHTESVTWIAGRTDVICSLFLLLALQLHVGGAPAWRRALAVLSFAAALLAKEMAVFLPFVVFVYEWSVARASWRRAALSALPYAAAVVAYLVWRGLIAGVSYNPPGEVMSGIHVLSLAKTLWKYIWKLAWPVRLSAYIQNPYVLLFSDPTAWLALLLAAGAAVFAWRRRQREPRVFLLLAAFALSFIPLSNIIRISAPADMGFPMSERFLYLPSAFALILLAWFLVGILPFRRTAWAIAAALILFWGGRTAARNTDWRNDVTFFTKCLEQAPDAPLLRASLGSAEARAGHFDEAVRQIGFAIEFNRAQTGQESYALLNNLAVIYRLAGRCEEALPILERLIRGTRVKAIYAYNLGRCLQAQGRHAEAERALKQTLEVRPNYPDALVALAEVREAVGDSAGAVEYYRRALSFAPKSPALHVALGVACKKAGRLADAAAAYRQALALDPGLAAARGNLGVVCALMDDLPAARSNLESAVGLDPRLWDVQNALGMVYARQRDIAAARAKFAEILAANPTNTDAVLNEGILFFQGGETNAARERFARALELDPEHARARAFLRQLGADAN